MVEPPIGQISKRPGNSNAHRHVDEVLRHRGRARCEETWGGGTLTSNKKCRETNQVIVWDVGSCIGNSEARIFVSS